MYLFAPFLRHTFKKQFDKKCLSPRIEFSKLPCQKEKHEDEKSIQAVI